MDKTVPAGAAISLALIQKIIGRKMTKAQTANANSVVVALQRYGPRFGLDQPHRLAQFLAQVLHESGAFVFDREKWGPTAQQKKYDTGSLAKKLGNTRAGDGFLFRGRTGMQITGRANTRDFRDWCRKLMSGLVLAAPGSAALPVPDFEKTPDAMLTDPWEGLGPIWYWDSRGISRYADQGDIEMVTKAINGGLTGYQDRLDWYARAALVLLGFGPSNVTAFQKQAGEKADGIAGPRTRAALHRALLARSAVLAPDAQAAPVVEEKQVEKPVVPVAVEAKVKEKTDRFGWLTGIFGGGTGLGLGWLAGFDWQAIVAIGGVAIAAVALFLIFRHEVVAAVKEVREELG